jgi:hypothetical protein
MTSSTFVSVPPVVQTSPAARFPTLSQAGMISECFFQFNIASYLLLPVNWHVNLILLVSFTPTTTLTSVFGSNIVAEIA